jgi:hypothetical protein
VEIRKAKIELEAKAKIAEVEAKAKQRAEAEAQAKIAEAEAKTRRAEADAKAKIAEAEAQAKRAGTEGAEVFCRLTQLHTLRSQLVERVCKAQELQKLARRLHDGFVHDGQDKWDGQTLELAMQLSKSQSAVLAMLDMFQRRRPSVKEQRRLLKDVINARQSVCDKVETVESLLERLKESFDPLLQRKAELDNIESRALELLDIFELKEAGPAAGGVWPIEVPSLLKEEASLSDAWTEYRDTLLREQALAATVVASDGPWAALEPSVLSAWAAASAVRGAARLRFDACVEAAQRKHEDFAQTLQVVAIELRDHILHDLRQCRQTVEKERAALDPALGRAQALHRRIIDIRDALSRQKSACDAYKEVRDQQDKIQDEIDLLVKAIEKAENRWESAEDEMQKVAEAKNRMKNLRSSHRFRRAVAQVHQLMKHLPELALRFRELDPFNGTAAQDFLPRELEDYEYEELPQSYGGRHRMLKARLRPQEQREAQVAAEAQDVRLVFLALHVCLCKLLIGVRCVPL